MKIYPHKTGLQRAIAPCTISLLLLQILASGVNVQSAWANPTVAQVNSVQFTPPPPPPDRDAPGNRGGGAGRGCGVSKQSITALMPEYQRSLAGGGENIQVWGTTISERPTFWFDVPYNRSTIASLEFVLQDNANPAKNVYRTAVSPPDTPGIVSIRLPVTVPPLETGKLYRWFFKVRLQCGANQTATEAKLLKEEIYGWVQRTNSSATLTAQLNQATPQQRVTLYAQNGIWFDALTTLGELRLTNPQDAQLATGWNTLLQAIDLEQLATQPLVPCCKPKAQGQAIDPLH